MQWLSGSWLTILCGEIGDEKGKSGKKRATLYMVTPYMEHDLSGMLTNPDIRFSEPQIKCYMQQLLEGLRYLHDVRSHSPVSQLKLMYIP